jgi:hypothetical protein
VSFSAVITFLTSSATPTTAPADIGIAAAYPGDKNIASDPAVIFADDFESYTSVTGLSPKWKVYTGKIQIATAGFRGRKCIEYALPISTTESGHPSTSCSVRRSIPFMPHLHEMGRGLRFTSNTMESPSKAATIR